MPGYSYCSTPVLLWLLVLVTLKFCQQQSSCNYNKQNRGASISGTVSIASGSESNLEAAVANVGPVAVAIDGASNAFRVSERILVNNVIALT